MNGSGLHQELDWFKSYLTGRCQRGKLGDCLSSKAVLAFGVPQGSGLGPLLFTVYTTAMSSMICGHSIPHRLYADDSQLCVTFASGTLLQHWMFCRCAWPLSSHGWWWINWNWIQIKLNSFLFGNEQHRSKYLNASCWTSSVESNPEKSAWNHGVIVDNNFTFRSHMSAVCSSCFYHMRDLLRIHCHLDLDTAKLLVTALVSSLESPPFTHSVPLLRSLHWLWVKFRILFKITLLANKTLHEKKPVYLHTMLAASIPSRSLRSNKGINLSIRWVKNDIGASVFQCCAPSLWINLLLSVCSATSVATFRKHLKTPLFDLAFSPQRPAHPMAHWCYGSASSIWLLNTIWLSHSWAWLCQGYWRYRNLIDWLNNGRIFSTSSILKATGARWDVIKLLSILTASTSV